MIHPLEWILKSKWCLKQEIIWNKNIAANIRGWRFWQIDERIYWLYKPIKNNKIGKELLSKHALLTSIWKLIPDKNISHPASFPIALPTRIIYSIMNDENGIVLDPYCGSGTTLVAAKFLKKNYIGIDISPKYVDISQKRLQNYTQEESKIQEELNKHLVIKTFTERKQEKKYKNIDSQKQSNLNLF
jgi:site-specific DNA-methyltransferase (adenine-specific)